MKQICDYKKKRTKNTTLSSSLYIHATSTEMKNTFMYIYGREREKF